MNSPSSSFGRLKPPALYLKQYRRAPIKAFSCIVLDEVVLHAASQKANAESNTNGLSRKTSSVNVERSASP